MKSQFIKTVKDDTECLIWRALRDQSIWAFGEDGFGKYAQHSMPSQFSIESIEVEIDDLDPKDILAIKCNLEIVLGGYDMHAHGCCATDKNVEIGLKQQFDKHDIDWSAFTWAPLDQQKRRAIVLQIDIEKLGI